MTPRTYPPAAEVRAFGTPYPFPTWQGAHPAWRTALAGPNAEAAALALAGYAHPFVWQELTAATETDQAADDEAARLAWHTARHAAEDAALRSGRWQVQHVTLSARRLTQPRGPVALAFLVADLIPAHTFDTLTRSWARVLDVPDLTTTPKENTTP